MPTPTWPTCAARSPRRSDYRRRLIITDGVFSMDGDIAPLDAICDVAEEHGIMLMVDDAHGEGVLGRGGRGIVDHFGLHGRVDVEVGTLSKAFGVVGGLVAGKGIIIEWLRQRGRPFLFSSAMTAPDAAACIEAVAILSESTELMTGCGLTPSCSGARCRRWGSTPAIARRRSCR
jgi:glycine C-acetyltransferase